MTRAPKIVFLGLAACGLLAVSGAAHHATAGEKERVPVSDKPIAAVLEEHTPRLMSLPGVVGVGQGLCAGAPCIKVFVVEKTPELVGRIGVRIESYEVEITESGEMRALDADGSG